MYGTIWCDTLPNFLYPLLDRPLLTWGVLGLMDSAAILLTYASLTRPMSRWCGILAWCDRFIEHVACGSALPDMPLFVVPGHYVYVPLQATYQAAYHSMPAFWRDVREGRCRS